MKLSKLLSVITLIICCVILQLLIQLGLCAAPGTEGRLLFSEAV